MRNEHHQLHFMDEMSHANAGHNHEQLVIDHLRAQVASLKGVEHNVYAEISYRDSEIRAESQGYQLGVVGRKDKEITPPYYEAKILREAMDQLETGVKENARTTEREKKQIKKANTALIEANSQLKRRGKPGFGDQDESELIEKVQNLERIVVDNEMVLKELREENTSLKVEMAEMQSSSWHWFVRR